MYAFISITSAIYRTYNQNGLDVSVNGKAGDEDINKEEKKTRREISPKRSPP